MLHVSRPRLNVCGQRNWRVSAGMSAGADVRSDGTGQRTITSKRKLCLLHQKSGLSARGTSASFPGYQERLSAHTISGQSNALSPSVRYVMVAVHGVVNMFLSSTVKVSCRYLPEAFGLGSPAALLCCLASRSNPSFAAS